MTRIRTNSSQLKIRKMCNWSTDVRPPKLSKLTIRKIHSFQKWRFGTNSSHGVKFAKCEICGSTEHIGSRLIFVLWGSGKTFDKNGAIWCILSAPKYVIINRKINHFKDNKSTMTKNYSPHFSPQSIQIRMLVWKWIQLYFKRVSGVKQAHKPKSNKMEAFPLRWNLLDSYFTFWQGSLNPTNYELAPQIP